MKCKSISAEKTLGCLFLEWQDGEEVRLCETERAVILFISSAPALWFLWGTDVHNSIQSLIPLNSLSVPAPPTACMAHLHTLVSCECAFHSHLHSVNVSLCSSASISCSWVNTWFNQVWLPPWSVCIAASQMCSKLLATWTFIVFHLYTLMFVNDILLQAQFSWIHIPD